MAHIVVDNPDDQTTTWTGGDFLPIPELSLRDLKTVAARTRVVKDARSRIPRKIFDLELVVIIDHR